MRVTRERRVTALANDFAEYEIKDSLWKELKGQGMSDEEALVEAKANGGAEVVQYSSEVDEVHQVHESDITVDAA